MASPQIDDQTDEDFFDKLVDDEFDGSQSKPEEISKGLSNLSIRDVDSGEPETADNGERRLEKVDILEPVQAPKKDSPFGSENIGSNDASAGKGDGPKGTSVKEVQWSAFSLGSSLDFGEVAGFEPFSEDFLAWNSDSSVEKPAENFSSNLGPTEQEAAQSFGLANEQAVNESDPQSWDNLYPGWKYDASTGQWYQVDSYDATADAQMVSSNAARVESLSESSAVSYLQQTSQHVLETIAEECTVSNASNWNNASQGSIQYPANMVFDPQYPDWYYDTNSEQWYTLQSYTQGLTNIENAVQNQIPEVATTLKGLSSDQNHYFHNIIGQSEQYNSQAESSPEFGQTWGAPTGNYAQQNSLYSNTGQSAQHAVQSQGSQDFGQAWDGSMSNHVKNSSLYNNINQSELTTNKGWGSQEIEHARSVSMGNLAQQNAIYRNTSTAAHHASQSQGSQDFLQNWNTSSSNYAQNNSMYNNISHSEKQTSQGQDTQGFGGHQDASGNTYAQHNMWPPQQVGVNAQTTGFSWNQQTESSYGSVSGSQTTQGIGFKAFEPVMNENHVSRNGVVGFQSFNTKENMYKVVPPKVERTLEEHLSNSYYEDQNSANSQVVNSSYWQFPYTPTDERSSAGRPPHALVAFGFGGKLLVMKNDKSHDAHLGYGSQESVSGAISVLNLSEVVTDKDGISGSGSSHDYFQALCQSFFPGPLVGGSAATKDVNKWIDQKIRKCESASIDPQTGEPMKLLFSLLKIMCQHYGKLRSPFGVDQSLEEVDGPESAVAKLFASAKDNGATLTEFGSFSPCMHNLPSEGQIRATAIAVQNLLVSGRRKEALQYAQEGQLWGPALVLAGQLGEQFYVDTVKKMAQREFVCGSPLRTLCLLIAGQPGVVFSSESPANNLYGSPSPTQVPANGMLDEWQRNIAIITANRTKDDELVLVHLGDCLLKDRGEITSAHTCYLVAEANFENYSDSARLCLIAADHWKCPRTFASPEAIQRTEVYEYSKVLGNSQFVLLPFQPYKLVYAYMLAEVGKVSESLKYCQASLKLLKNAGRIPEVEMWKTLLSSLEERLRTHQQGGYSSNLAPAKLVGKLFTSIDRSIHRMIGAPPASLPPLPHSSPNNKDSFSIAPKVVTSQSTMAMSKLMPSASVEAISEWTGDSSKKSMHNRSISEPDFSRSPKQDSGLFNGHGKQSESTSRFGRIGSQIFQKTIGWVARSRPERQAKLGESNKFYYDENLKRWVEEGAKPPAEEAALPPPPMAPAFQNGTSEYNINSALKDPGPLANGGSETKASGFPPTPSEPNTGIPPIPPSQNQFSARARMGVRSRYVDTFNKGGVGGSGGALANSFQSPAAPSIKPAIGAKFFIPMAPAPSDEQKSDAVTETIQEPTMSEEPSTSTVKETIFSLTSPSSSSPSTPSLQRFPSVDSITPSTKKAAASHSDNGPFSQSRSASWSGIHNGATSHKAAGFVGASPSLRPQNPPSTCSSSGMSLQLNGSALGDELQEVEL